jgi:hypothetical protein
MIVGLYYSDLKGYAIEAKIKEKNVLLYMRVFTDMTNIEEAVNALRGNRYVVGVEYSGDTAILSKIDLSGLNVLIHYKVDLSEEIVDSIMQSIPSTVNVVFNLDENYSDLRRVLELSKKYNNIRFCGGYMLRIPDVRIGCIRQEDLKLKRTNNKVDLVCSGCSCIFPTKSLDEYDDVIFRSEKEVKFGGLESNGSSEPRVAKKSGNLAKFFDEDISF